MASHEIINAPFDDNFEKPLYEVFLEFDNINYKINGKKPKDILQNCSGVAYPGRLLAIIGSSGAGKSSLLDILSGRLRSNKKRKITGSLKINGTNLYDKKAFKQCTAYVLQQDLIYETLKVKETLELSALLRLPKTMKTREKMQKVEKLLKLLDLKNCQNVCVGGNMIRGVSGGERKRVSIGNELITNPSLFFVDEPTSGLDSYNAFKLVEILRSLARSGRTVIATIHQPSSEIFRLFDDLIVLSKGYILYNGPAAKSVQVFEKLGYPILENCNPADHFIATTIVKNDADFDKIKKISLEYKTILSEIQNMEKTENSPNKMIEKMEPIKSNSSQMINCFKQTFLLTTKRSLKNYLRNPSTTYIRLVQILFFSLLSGILFFRLGNSFREARSRSGALFFVNTNLMFNAALNVVLVFPTEKKIMLNELSNGMYSLFPYYASKFLVEVPINILFILLYQFIVYWMVGFGQNANQFFVFFLIIITSVQVSYFLGLLISTAAPSPEIAIALISFALLPSMLFSGFFIVSEDMQVWISWATYANFFRYANDMLNFNEFNNFGLIEICEENVCRFITGKQYLESFNLRNLNFWGWYGILIGFLCFYFLATYLLLLFQTRKTNAKRLVPKEEKIV